MGIADDLRTLQELHEKGKLTDTEFSAAKAEALKGIPPQSAPQQTAPQQTAPKAAGLSHPRFWLLLILVGVIVWFWYNAGTKQTTQTLATVVHAPIELMNEIQNVPASSWKAVPFTTTYQGSVTIKIQVVHGNPMDIFVISTDQLSNLKANQSVLTYTDFDALKTQVYERTARLNQGTYYLVMRDRTLGILSSQASDISVKIQLNP